MDLNRMLHICYESQTDDLILLFSAITLISGEVISLIVSI